MTKAEENERKRRERWENVAPRRVENVRKAIARLARCGNTSNYQHTDTEVDRIFDTLTADLLRAREKFRPRQRESVPTFSLDDMRPASEMSDA